MKTYTKPIAEVKEFGLSGAIADLSSYLSQGDNAKNLGIENFGSNAIASYSMAS